MAVYTQVSDDALATFLAEYSLGVPTAFKGIAEGVENSNYFLETTTGRYILTLFEKRVDADDLPYFVQLKQHLAAKGFPCPEPIMGKDGAALRTLEGRPAIIVSFLEGLSPRQPNTAQCRAVGAGLAQMHQALADFDMQRPNSLGPATWPGLWKGLSEGAEALQPGLSDDIEIVLTEIAAAKPDALNLPRGTIHADLFSDNAFFLDDKFTGMFDFYFACTDALAYDLAICLNAWAFDESPGADKQTRVEYNFSKGANLIAGYESALPVLARGAALRFFLTRMTDWTRKRPKKPLA
ncbi:UNVERIFIED_CONTAM: hypothetical protein GTU68_029531 [Idotea baltica]|nr:hypothetical protein [Idotea baltica]